MAGDGRGGGLISGGEGCWRWRRCRRGNGRADAHTAGKVGHSDVAAATKRVLCTPAAALGESTAPNTAQNRPVKSSLDRYSCVSRGRFGYYNSLTKRERVDALGARKWQTMEQLLNEVAIVILCNHRPQLFSSWAHRTNNTPRTVP